MPLMSTAGGGDQVKERTVELCATPLTDWGDDDGATTKEIGEKLFFPTIITTVLIYTCLKSPKSNRLSCIS